MVDNLPLRKYIRCNHTIFRVRFRRVSLFVSAPVVSGLSRDVKPIKESEKTKIDINNRVGDLLGPTPELHIYYGVSGVLVDLHGARRRRRRTGR